MPRDPYAVLGVVPTASPSEITRAYRQLLRRYHPDTRDAVADGAEADAELGELLKAYSTVGDAARRADYDRRRAAYDRRRATAGRRVPVRPVTTADNRAPRPRTADVDPASAQPPPLWVGPVRWHRGG